MKYSKKEIFLSTALCLLPILMGLYLWNDLPDMVPTHFNVNNEPDGWSSKAFAVFGLPGIMAGLNFLCLFGVSADPKYHRQAAVLQKLFLWFVPALSCVLMPITLLMALGHEIDLGGIISVFMGVVFVVVGNYLPKCRQNYTMGIKLPWTLSDENNWNYTHRLGGFCWVVGGFLVTLAGLLRMELLLFPIVLFMVLVPCTASYLYYRRHGKGEEA